MLFNEIFYKNSQLANEKLFVRQAGELLEDTDYCITRSNSPTHTLGFLKSGRIILTFKNKTYSFEKGQSIFLPRDISYIINADKTSPPHFFWVNLRGTLIDAIAENLFGKTYAISNAEIYEEIKKIKILICDFKDNSTEISELVFKSLLKIFNSKLSENPEGNSCSEYELYISNSIQSGFSVAKMAEHFNCSTDTINRSFKKKYGVTPYRYYQNLRIEISKTLLCRQNFTIDDIAERLHFTDRNYFTLYFKSVTGLTPIEYRKKKS